MRPAFYRRFFSCSTIKLNSLDSFNLFNPSNASSTITYKLPKIDRCRRDGINVAGINLKGGLVLLNGSVLLWDVLRSSQITVESLLPFSVVKPAPEILVIGTGENMVPLSKEVITYLKENNVTVEVCNSKNACATYNILLEEDRNVACAIVPIEPTSAREYNSPPQ